MGKKNKATTYEQALRTMRKFQDEYAIRFHSIITVQTYYNGRDHKSLEVVAAVWDDNEVMQQRSCRWSSHDSDATTFKDRFKAFKKEFVDTFINGEPVNISY